MSTITVRDDILSFAAAVRDHLDDLPADEADELLDGLEADLSDQAAEAGEEFELPDAAAYAAELRAAAGLPERSEKPASKPSLRERLDAADARAARWISTHPVTAATRDFLVALRPVWWILRGVTLFLVLVPLLGITPGRRRGDLLDHMLMLSHPLAWLLLIALLLLSVQWGRGRWLPVRWLRVARTIVNVATAVVAPFVLGAAFVTVSGVAGTAAMTQSEAWTPTPGLAIDGERVRNIFAYDENGQRLQEVQLFDQDGKPLTTVGYPGSRDEWDYYFYNGGGPTPVAEVVAGRGPVWNVFPLRELAFTDGNDNADDAVAPTFPFAEVPPLPTTGEAEGMLQAQGAESAPAVGETPAVSPSPTTGAPAATPSPTETPAP